MFPTRTLCRGGRLCPPAENADFTKNPWKFDTFQRADRVVGPYKGAIDGITVIEREGQSPSPTDGFDTVL